MKKNKKIGLVMAQPPSYSETFLVSKIQNLINDGFDVILFSNLNRSNNTDATFYSSFTELSILQLILRFPYFVFKILQNYRSIIRYKNYISQQHISALSIYKNIFSNLHILFHPVNHIHFEFSVLAIDKEYLAKSMDAKMTASFRGYDVGISILKRKFDIIWKNIDAVHTISDDLVNRALKHGLNPETPIIKIHPAINTAQYIIKKNPGSISTPLRLISVGRLHWKKGYHYTFAALKLLKEQGVDFIFTLVGTGEQFEELMFMVNKFNLQNHIHFVGKKKAEEIIELLHQNHIYIQFSEQEGFCNAVLEAQSCGLLVVTSDAEGLQENVLNNETGWIVKRRDINALNSKINEIIKLPIEVRKKIAIQAATRVKKDFDLKQQKDLFSRFFNQVN